MIDTLIRPVPRWLHVWAVATAFATLAPLGLGQLVTSLQAGMADPIWPTEPWYLLAIDWQEPSRGYLIEHTHRIAGFSIGAIVATLAVGLFWTDPNRTTRWIGLAALVVLLMGYGKLHQGLIAQREVQPENVRLPVIGTVVTLLGIVSSVAIAVMGLLHRTPGSLLRILGVLALIGVMIQGLFGGARVLFNALMGGQLALVHGIFAQLVFCLLVAIAVLSGRTPGESTHPRRLNRGSIILAAVLFLQIVLGALVRHASLPSPIVLRFHFLTAFVATALAIWLLLLIARATSARQRVGASFWLLGLVLALQLVLGVEAWMERFGQYTLPELVKLTTAQAAIRTAHAFVGSCLLATAVLLALRLCRPTSPGIATPDRTVSRWSESEGLESRGAVVGSGVRGEVP